jgi:hypothetical protein
MIRCMDRRRLFYYILLNVFISACVTGTILYWYDRNLKATSSSVPSPQTQSFDFAQDKPEAAAAVPEANLSPNRDIPIGSCHPALSRRRPARPDQLATQG